MIFPRLQYAPNIREEDTCHTYDRERGGGESISCHKNIKISTKYFYCLLIYNNLVTSKHRLLIVNLYLVNSEARLAKQGSTPPMVPTLYQIQNFTTIQGLFL